MTTEQLQLFDGTGHQVGDVFAHHRSPESHLKIIAVTSKCFQLLELSTGKTCYLYGSLLDSMLRIS